MTSVSSPLVWWAGKRDHRLSHSGWIMRCSHNAKFSLALSQRSVNTSRGLFNTCASKIIHAVLVYKHGFSSQLSWNTLGLLKLEQKQGVEVFPSGCDVVAIMMRSAQTSVNTSVVWWFSIYRPYRTIQSQLNADNQGCLKDISEEKTKMIFGSAVNRGLLSWSSHNFLQR